MAHLHNNLYLLGRGVVHHQRISSAEGGVCHVYLIGTVHSTQESFKDVSDVIKFIKPEIVFLELCDERYTEMLSEEIQVQTLKNLFYMWIRGTKTLINFLYCWYLMKRGGIKKMLAKSEFKAAYEAANEIGAKVVPGDQSLEKTLDRLWARMTIMEKVMMACNYFFKILFFQSREHDNEYKGIDDEDIELLNSFPPAYETLAEEHHMYMAHNLWKEVGQSSSVVAVLERSHLNRIRRYWHITFLVDVVHMEALSEVPTVKEHSSTVKIFASMGVVIITLIGIYLWRKN